MSGNIEFPARSVPVVPQFEVHPDLTTERLAETWFNPEEMAKNESAYRIRTAALVGLDPTDEDSLKIANRLFVGFDPLLARLLVMKTLDDAYQEHEGTFDKTTGLKTYDAWKDWQDRVYGRSLAAEIHIPETITHPRTATIFSGDLNNFKRINDKLGHRAGDRVLGVMAREMHDGMRAGDRYAAARGHKKGDETFLTVVDLDSRQAAGMYKRLCTAQQRKIENDRQQVIWSMIDTAMATCPSNNRFDHVTFERRQRIDQQGKLMFDTKGGPMIEEDLVINGYVICPSSDLTVIDWGYAHGVVDNLEVLPNLENMAEAQRDAKKKENHKQTGGAYRSH